MTPDFSMRLPKELEEYRDHKSLSGGDDHSGIELRIITFLRKRNWSEEEIIDYCNYHELPKHCEDYQKSQNYSATISRIATADEYLAEQTETEDIQAY